MVGVPISVVISEGGLAYEGPRCTTTYVCQVWVGCPQKVDPPGYRRRAPGLRARSGIGEGELFAGHLVTGRVQDLLPADGTQSLLVSATWKGDRALA